MAKKFDEVVASAVYTRMKDEGATYRFMQDILQAVFPDTSEEVILLFIAKCLNSPPPPSDRMSRQKRESSSLRDDFSSSSSGCGGSGSGRPGC